jgi:uncharacterized membrane protein
MAAHLNEWLHLLLRWAHLIAGIAWIGSSFYFIWLDSHLTASSRGKEGVEGELWMVHSGGFYQVEKYRIRPGWMPDKELHWFKYEALLTWITGFLLLNVVYYLTGGAFLVDPAVSSISTPAAVALGLGSLAVSWLVYDGLFVSPLARRGGWAVGLSFALLGALILGLTHVFSGRAAYIHVGAVLGTLMVANVWIRILPAQRQMLEATRAGKEADHELGKAAKRRSVHNSYMTLPVLFIMLSNHFPTTYASPHSAGVLALLIVLGAAFRHYMIVGSRVSWLVPLVATGLLGLVILTAPALQESATQGQDVAAARAQPAVPFAQAQAIVQSRCVACHAARPADATFGPMPGGVSFEEPERMRTLAERIKFRAVVSRTMPLANKTGITDEERALLGRWVDQGAKLE